MNVLELYSGIGGLHLALKKSGIKGDVVCSIEINPSANKVYGYNFPNTFLLNYNLENLTAEFVNQLKVDTILMSPPCQPFTRNGLKKDVQDPRTSSFLRILSLLPHTTVRKILIENVKGFETSEMREKLTETLMQCKFVFQEFILSPSQFGIPNTRHRYYCLAKRIPDSFSFQTGPLMTKLPGIANMDIQFSLSKIVEENCNGHLWN
ncbi:tRNA (cytosine-5-)-methyltransferase isoform X2 [Agrilus planipennis]|uniref:tRNA (Cytosine-5-)-methyltransferase isoform X2 n=1 Tax=Agrilus planipennis TaxID=224129 RepID=A0A1W4XR41_AGRPL|nr:tRNA (cytosine-5-)-methyltransferase isoform X2 [Agrilus planipennis]